MKTINISLLAILVSASLAIAQKRDVSFEGGDVTLKGTLYTPKGDGPFPAVVFVHGSGAETRSNSNYSAKWMASIGYMALTFDKRGTGESNGDEAEINRFSFDDLSNDVVAAVKFLSEVDEVNQAKIGLHAASQGGWVAPLAAFKTDLVNFMIIKSASVCSVGDDRVFERAARLRREGFNESEIAEARKMQLVEARTIPDDNAQDEFTQLFEQNKDKNWFSRVYGGSDPLSQSLTAYRKWYASIEDFNPVPYLEQMDIPVFWIFGDSALDQLGPVQQSISTLEELKKSGKSYKIVSYDGEGHNVKERKYELELYRWLSDINRYDSYKFKKH